MLGAGGVAAVTGCSSRSMDGGAQVVTRTESTTLAPSGDPSSNGLDDAVAVADDGTTVLVGGRSTEAPDGVDTYGTVPGAAFVFIRREGEWEQRTILAGEGLQGVWGFGDAVALADGGTALVGAPNERSGDYTGAAYVFARGDDGWSRRAMLEPRDREVHDSFGRFVALDGAGTTALVAGEVPDTRLAGSAVSAYVFTREGTGWSQSAELLPTDARTVDSYKAGMALDDDGSTAIVGGVVDDTNATGAAFLFERVAGSWEFRTTLTPDDSDDFGFFGHSVALAADGATALVGASGGTGPDGDGESGLRPGPGAAYVFTREGGDWRQQARLTAADGRANDDFGAATAIAADGRGVVVGARLAGVDGEPEVGKAYRFEREDDEWTQTATLVSSDGAADSHVGESVGYDAGTTVLGSDPDGDPTYVFDQ